jgi:signal transduction histidine kinase/ligand-binding sensor domain-containing protein
MTMSSCRRHLAATAALACIATAFEARAQQVVFRRFDVRAGLAHGRVEDIHEDRRGFIWFATWQGVSRFDGERFVTLSHAEGLEKPLVRALTEDRSGRIWMANWQAGVVTTMDPQAGGTPARRLQQVARIDDPTYDLAIDSTGVLWVVTEKGLIRCRSTGGDSLRAESIDGTRGATSACTDHAGRAWITAGERILRLDGEQIFESRPQEALGAPLVVVEPGTSRTLLAATEHAVFEIDLTVAPPVWRRLAVDLPAAARIRDLARSSQGALWIATVAGLARFEHGITRIYTTREGLPGDIVRTVHVDRDDNVWIGTHGDGACVWSGERLVRFGNERDPVHAFMIMEARDGRIYATTDREGTIEILPAGGVHRIPGSTRTPFLNLYYNVAQDQRGDWWLGTPAGLYRFAGPTLQFAHGRGFDHRDGIPARTIMGLMYDADHDRLHVSTTGDTLYTAELDAAAPRFVPLALPPDRVSGVRVMQRDRAGNLWLAGFNGLARLAGSRLEFIPPSAGLPEAHPRWLYFDRRGALWVGLRNLGVSVSEDPAAAEPRFENLSTASGLGSNTVWCVCEDDSGTVYLATGHGVDRFEPGTRRVEHLDIADGLPGEHVPHCMRDRHGRIWFATSGGVARFDPGARTFAAPPRATFITRMVLNGVEQPLPLEGVRHFDAGRAGHDPGNVLVEFVSPSGARVEGAHYRTQLEGAEADFSARTNERVVRYAHLGSGDYRFVVRAEDAGGRTGDAATVTFRIVLPFYRTSWFFASILAAIAAAVWGLHRLRVRQLLALEAVRRQIALDLHDDIGAGLSQIAVLNEIGRRDAPAATANLFEQSAEQARALRSSMSDIVWAIDPRKDRLADLVERMRQVSYQLLAANGIQVEFDAPEPAVLERTDLAPDRRRHLLLGFKEAIHNIARHAGATRVRVRLERRGPDFLLRIEDDGRGFDPAATSQGHGLRGMAQRAAALGGRFELDTAVGAGTRVLWTVPIRQRRPTRPHERAG